MKAPESSQQGKQQTPLSAIIEEEKEEEEEGRMDERDGGEGRDVWWCGWIYCK